MDLVGLVIQLASGAIAGSLAGSRLERIDLGLFGNMLAGAVGGALGGQIVERSMGAASTAGAASLDFGTLAVQVVSGGVGGCAVMAIVGVLSRLFAR